MNDLLIILVLMLVVFGFCIILLVKANRKLTEELEDVYRFLREEYEDYIDFFTD